MGDSPGDWEGGDGCVEIRLAGPMYVYCFTEKMVCIWVWGGHGYEYISVVEYVSPTFFANVQYNTGVELADSYGFNWLTNLKTYKTKNNAKLRPQCTNHNCKKKFKKKKMWRQKKNFPIHK